MEKHKKFNFGIVGGGLIADFHAKAIKDIPNAELAYIYGRDHEKTIRLAEKFQCKACEN